MPSNQAQEKYEILKALGVKLVLVPPVPFTNENHFYHTAKKLAAQTPNSFWVNQFENLANFQQHFETTGPEIWNQTNGQVSAFVSSSGTGGTLAGVSQFLKSKNSKIHIRLVDPMGSGLHHYLQSGVLKSEGSSITEGIGIMRLTENFKKAILDDSKTIHDQQMISMLYFLAEQDGLLVGTSAALNVMGSFLYALENKNSGKKIVTVLCDSAMRYQSKIFNAEFLKSQNLDPQMSIHGLI